MNTRSKELLNRITYKPGLMEGRPTIRGLRFPVADIVELLASGMNTDDILVQHPLLEREDIAAALYYAASNMSAMAYTGGKRAAGLPEE